MNADLGVSVARDAKGEVQPESQGDPARNGVEGAGSARSGYFRAFSWNVNGLRAVINRGDLQKFMQEFTPDVLALQEIKISEAQLPELKLPELFPGYDMFWSFAERKGYAGTAIWVKKYLQANNIEGQTNQLAKVVSEGGSLREKRVNPVATGVDDAVPDRADSSCLDDNCDAAPERSRAGSSDLEDKYGHACDEGRLTAVQIGDALIVSMYTPNSKEDLSRIPLRMSWDAHVNEILKPQKKVLIMGDFNVANEPIDVAKPENKKGAHGFTVEERQSFKNYLAAGLKDVWREENPEKVQYTWWSFRVKERGLNGWRIDYTLAKGLNAKDAAIYDQVRGSDHCPISVEVDRAN